MLREIEAMKIVYQSILSYLENEQVNADDLQNLFDVLTENEIFQEKNRFKLILHLISSIANNHKRSIDLFPRIENILQSMKKEMKQFFSNDKIFEIFKNNKKILLFLFNEKIITPNKYLFSAITNYKNDVINNYSSFFYPEFKSFFTNNSKSNEIDHEEFDKKRQIGENDSSISYLIRNDLIDDFIVFISKSNFPLSYEINSSVFETNKFLIDKNPTLIEYACFFGSIQIFKYLQLNGVKLTSSLCQYAIHGRNTEIIHLLEEALVFPSNNEECLLESIKCHHNEIADYIQLNYCENGKSKSYLLEQSIRYYNFSYITNEILNNSDAFFYLCKKDYCHIVELLLDSPLNSVNINKQHEKWNENKKDGFEITLNDFIQQDLKNEKLRKRYQEFKTPLIAVIEKRNHEMIKILLKNKNIDVNIKFQSYFSICYDGNIPYISGGDDKSILFIAAEKGYSEIVQLLINRNDINVNEINGIEIAYITKEFTALHIAIQNEHIETIKILLRSKDIDPNIYGSEITSQCSYYDKTPLVLAIEKDNLQIVRLLISKKDINLNIGYHYHSICMVDDGQDHDETIQYLTSLQIAQKRGNKEIIQIITQYLS